MWYFLPEWIKFWKKRNAEPTQEEVLSEIIRKRAEEQQAVIDRKIETDIDKIKETEKFQSVGCLPDKDFFE